MGRTQDLGKDAEARAETILNQHGLVLLARNYRCRGGEVDLIMRDGEHLVFIEVRYRSHRSFGGAASSVDLGKQRRVILAARHYLLFNSWSGPCRFDVVAFEQDAGQWIRDAFST